MSAPVNYIANIYQLIVGICPFMEIVLPRLSDFLVVNIMKAVRVRIKVEFEEYRPSDPKSK
jgi:hypothetical protein